MSETMNTSRILELVEEKKEQFITLSDAIWAVPELGLAEHRSAGLLIQALEREGFQVERGIDGIETAFVGTYGSGRPVIGLLAEYDALPGLSQEAACTSHKPLAEGEPGHGCGHNALGAGVVAAAVAVKDYLKEYPGAGTVKVFGCPGEEAGWSKMFLARDGYFKDVDACFTWHPGNCNSVQGYSSNANICVYFTFRGRSAHAAAAPHLGRSALDKACELMNVGVNYLREHVPTEVRMHYAYQNAGEKAPNVVHANACLKYYIRAPKMALAVQVLERVKDVARGAALMTGTECDINVTAGMSDFIANDAISRLFVEAFNLAGPPQFDAQDEALARAFWDQYSENEKAAAMMTDQPVVPGRGEVPGHAPGKGNRPLFPNRQIYAGLHRRGGCELRDAHRPALGDLLRQRDSRTFLAGDLPGWPPASPTRRLCAPPRRWLWPP